MGHVLVPGQLVDVKEYGRATLLELGSSSGEQAGRVKVQYEDGSTRWCRASKCRPLRPSSKPIVVCDKTKVYRTAVVQNVSRGDVCLEVGCHEGLTTHMLSTRCNWVVGVDMCEAPVQAARARFPTHRFEVLDGSDTAGLQALLPPGQPSYTKICVDIGGTAPLPLVLGMVCTLRAAFPAAQLIVKSIHLARYAAQMASPDAQGVGLAAADVEVFSFDPTTGWAAAGPPR